MEEKIENINPEEKKIHSVSMKTNLLRSFILGMIFVIIIVFFSGSMIFYKLKAFQNIDPIPSPAIKQAEITISPTKTTTNALIEMCPESNGMTYDDALKIAQNSECTKQGIILTAKQCNSNGTGYWWLDYKPNSPKSGCNPACVVDVAAKKAEINWRCTGLIPPAN